MLWLKARGLLFCLSLLVLCAAVAAQDFSRELSFQGRLAEPGTGAPLPDGEYQVTFTIYDVDAEGNALWQETQDVTQTGGVFNVFLGTITPFPSDLFTNGDRWLSLQVSGDAEMPERFPFTPAPWALHAANSDKADGFDASSTPTADHLLALGEDAKLALEAIPQGEGSGLDSDTVDGYHAEDLMGPGGDFVELAPGVPQTGAAVDLVGQGGDAGTIELENAGLALAARTVSGGTVSAWTQMSPGAHPAGRDYSAMAWDAQSDRVMLFGGQDPYVMGDTWAYDYNNDTWTQMTPSSPPSARSFHAMAYDAESDCIILFGGYDGNYLDDTWAYDHDTDTWTQMSPTGSPSARSHQAMTYDAASDRIILFGGYDGSYLGDTWAYDHNTDTWTQMSPTDNPSPRRACGTAYDSESDRVILFGGYNNNNLGETWAYDYNSDAWEQMSPATHPSNRYSPGMVYHAWSDRVVAFGGFGGGWLDDTWTYDLETDAWEQISAGDHPSQRRPGGMAYDAESRRAILFGGWDNNPKEDTWAFSRYDSGRVADFDGSVAITGDLSVGGAISGTTENADKVDGFDASATPTPDTILPLDAQGKIPLDVIEGPFPPDDDWTISGDDIYRLDGYVGIGTDAPSARLEIQVPESEGGGIRISDPDTLIAVLADGGSSDEAGILRLYDTGGSERVRLFAYVDGPSWLRVGNVGIGTDSPQEKLHVAGDIRLSAGGDIAFADDNTRIHELNDDLYLEADNDIYIFPDNDIRIDGSTLSVDGSANMVGIGVYDPQQKLDVNGRVRIRDFYTSGTSYDVQVQSTGDLVKVSSSRRYKGDIRDLCARPDDALGLRPVSFRWKETGDADIGLIAEEVAELIPDLVVYDGKGRPDAVRYDKLALYLLSIIKDQENAMRRLQASNEALERRIEALEGK